MFGINTSLEALDSRAECRQGGEKSMINATDHMAVQIIIWNHQDRLTWCVDGVLIRCSGRISNL